MSILTHLGQNKELLPPRLDLLYTYRQSYPPHKQGTATIDTDSFKEPVLFFRRLTSLFASDKFPQKPHDQNSYRFSLFLTPPMDPGARKGRSNPLGSEDEVAEHHRNEGIHISDTAVCTKRRRIADADLIAPVNDMSEEMRKGVVAYVCGPPSMTDWAVRTLRSVRGVVGERVLCEKWW